MKRIILLMGLCAALVAGSFQCSPSGEGQGEKTTAGIAGPSSFIEHDTRVHEVGEVNTASDSFIKKTAYGIAQEPGKKQSAEPSIVSDPKAGESVQNSKILTSDDPVKPAVEMPRLR